MADLPRWVDLETVDGKAMLGAYIAYLQNTQKALKEKHGVSYQPHLIGQLPVTMHRDPPHLAPLQEGQFPSRLPQRPCQDPQCARCDVRGGYTFRWYSPYWARHYNSVARPGAWIAPEPEFEVTQEEYLLIQERFWRPESQSDLQ